MLIQMRRHNVPHLNGPMSLAINARTTSPFFLPRQKQRSHMSKYTTPLMHPDIPGQNYTNNFLISRFTKNMQLDGTELD